MADHQAGRLGDYLTGATIKHFTGQDLARYMFPLPPLAEQRRIAEVLDRAEALRDKRRAALAQLDSLTQSLFLDLFGDPKSNLKAWPQKAMAELFATSPIFGTMIPPVAEKRGWLSLRVGNIQDWSLDLSDQKYVELPSASRERHSVKDGDLLLARAIASQDHLGKCVIAHPNGEQWAFDSHLMRLRFDLKHTEPEFIRHLFMTPGGRSIFLRASRKSTVQFNINTKEMSALQIPVPPIELQREFARRVTAVEKLKTAQRASLAELDALFATLQHRAFRGELRV
jgi:type I restriction enzyme S subunit